MNTLQKELPEDCQRARDAHGLALADGAATPADARAHATGCDACAKAFARMEKVWGVAGDVVPRLARPTPRLDVIAERALAAGRAPDVHASPAPVRAASDAAAAILPLRARRAPARRAEFAPIAAALALAAMVAVVALVGPSLVPPPPSTVAKNAPTPSGTPRVSLAKAFGDVSLVPADGSVVKTPGVGDTLPPGLFSASKGAALSIEGAGLLAVRGDTTVLIGGASGAPDLAVARGEIFVDLPKGTIRTFVVHTPTGTVNVTGTAFTVKVQPTDTQVDVTRGTVVVKGPNGERAINAGEAAKLVQNGAPVAVTATEPATDPLSWVRDLAPEHVPPAPVVAIRARTRTDATRTNPAALPVEVLPGLDRSIVEMAMDKRAAAMRHCYEEELVKDPGFVVRAALKFRIDDYGKPEDLTVSGIPAAHAALGPCLIQAASAAVFPSPQAGTELEVDYPVRFEPLSK
ncbi:MAG TPA: FecR domain-containing protein [bacterium]|nr:FecR domain-containing protein [bacterium]